MYEEPESWQKTEEILIIKKNLEKELTDLKYLEKLNFGPKQSKKVTTFVFHNMRYILKNDKFISIKHYIMNKTVRKFMKDYQYGNLLNDIKNRRITFGVNEMKIHEHSILMMVVHELLSTLGMFEIISFFIMSFEYRFFSIVMVFFFVISVITQIVSEKKCEQRIKKLASYNDKIIVIRRNDDKTFSKTIIK